MTTARSSSCRHPAPTAPSASSGSSRPCGSRGRRSSRGHASGFWQRCVRYAALILSKASLTISVRPLAFRCLRPRPVPRAGALTSDLRRAAGAARRHGRARPAEHEHVLAPPTPTEPPVQDAAPTERLDIRADQRHGDHRRARSCVLAARARVFHHPGPHLLQRARSTSSTAPAATTTWSDHVGPASSDPRAGW